MDYFYVPPQQIKDDIVEIKGAELKHLSGVSRKRVHDIIAIVDGLGTVYTVLLTRVGRKIAIGQIQKRARYVGEPNFKLTLAIAIPKGNRFDFLIEKGTEIGVSRFIPLITERSVVKGSDTKFVRWRKIAIAAMKQCTRCVIPEIIPPRPLRQVIESEAIHDFSLLAHPLKAQASLSDLINERRKKLARVHKLKTGIVLIGPEGGFTDDEVQFALSNNYSPFNLGSRRLRSETAGIMTASIVIELVENNRTDDI